MQSKSLFFTVNPVLALWSSSIFVKASRVTSFSPVSTVLSCANTYICTYMDMCVCMDVYVISLSNRMPQVHTQAHSRFCLVYREGTICLCLNDAWTRAESQRSSDMERESVIARSHTQPHIHPPLPSLPLLHSTTIRRCLINTSFCTSFIRVRFHHQSYICTSTRICAPHTTHAPNHT